MTSKLTRLTDEELEELAFYAGESTCHPDPNYQLGFESLATGSSVLSIVRELQERRRAAMDSESVGTFRKSAVGYTPSHHEDAVPLYAAPQLSPERDQVRREHADWSQATFGNVGPVGPLKHLSKEALETAAEPGDLSEWADMQFLLWDAQRRAGITDEQITRAMIEKLVVNKQREWPEPKDGEPRLHIKEQPAPVVPETAHSSVIAEQLAHVLSDMEVTDHQRAVISCAVDRLNKSAAMLQAGNSPVIGIDPASGPDRTVEVRYVAPPGYVIVPKEPTKEMIDAGWQYFWDTKNPSSKGTYKAMLAAALQEVK